MHGPTSIDPQLQPKAVATARALDLKNGTLQANARQELLETQKVVDAGKTASILLYLAGGVLVAGAYELVLWKAGIRMFGLLIHAPSILVAAAAAWIGNQHYENAIERFIDALGTVGRLLLNKQEESGRPEPPAAA